MMRRLPEYMAICLLAVLALCSACRNGEEPQQGSGESMLDKYPVLNEACASWKQGGGALATGGQGANIVYHVTSLEDKDAYMPVKGTIRYALVQSGTRIVVFDVAGTIHLKAPLRIASGNISILGQSAPGEGITIADYPIIIDKTSNVIMRFIRVRLGNDPILKGGTEDYDALSVNNCKNILIDHCSFSWSVDECVSCYGNEDFTLQYCFVTESLRKAGHEKGDHGYGGIWGGKNASFHHNLLAHHNSRNPRFDHDFVNTKYAGPIDYVNNVVYNWGGNSTYGGEGTNKGAGGRHINMVNNYYKHGPSTGKKNRLVDPTVSCDENCVVSPGGKVEPGKFYLSGNYMFGDDNVTNNNWKGSTQQGDNVKAAARWTEGLTSLTQEQKAEEAFETVLTKAGCSYRRDAVDKRIVDEVRNKQGKLINSPSDVGGWPVLDTGTPAVDADNDGMPDEWELKYGLNPNDVSDALKKTLVSDIPNIEVYLNDIVKDLY